MKDGGVTKAYSVETRCVKKPSSRQGFGASFHPGPNIFFAILLHTHEDTRYIYLSLQGLPFPLVIP